MPTVLTYGSGGWEAQEWFATANAPGKITDWDPAAPRWSNGADLNHLIGPYPIWLENNGWMHYLADPRNINLLARTYFNLNISTNPYIQGNFILAMFTKNGGPPLVHVGFPVLCETQPYAGERVGPAQERVRLTADHLEVLGRVSDAAAHEHPTEDFEPFLKKILPTGMAPDQDQLFRDEAKIIFNRSLKK
jgi:hypothetical protein